MLAGQADSPEGRAALDRLLEAYHIPLRSALMEKHRLTPEAADDALQGFVAEKIMEKGILRLADRSRGKFRTFLLNALENYFFNELRRASAQMRRPEGGFTELVPEVVDGVAHPAAVTSHAMDVAWAVRVMEQACQRMEAEYGGEVGRASSHGQGDLGSSAKAENTVLPGKEGFHPGPATGRKAIWEVFAARLVRPLLRDKPEECYDSLVTRLGLKSPSEAANLLTTGKRAFDRHVRAVIAEYEADEKRVEEELRDLIEILAGHRAWPDGGAGKEG